VGSFIFFRVEHTEMRVKDVAFHTRVKDIKISYFDRMGEPISSMNLR